MNPPVEVDHIGQASSMGRKRREHTKPEEEGEARNGGGNPSPGRDLPRKPKSFPPSIAASRTEREGEIEKMEACGMAEGKGMERSRHMVRAGIPITPSLHQLVPDGP